VLICPDTRIGRGRLTSKNLAKYLGALGAVLGFAGGIFVFVKVQILQSYPFYRGVFGDEPFLFGLTYTVALEVFGAVAVSGVFLWSYSKYVGSNQKRLVRAAAKTSLFFGVVVAAVVYVETRVLWGEILPGIHIWSGLPGGGGYPWGTEQVASNTCFISSPIRGDCSFLNYNELLLIALLAGLVGFLVLYSGSSGEPDPSPRSPESFRFSSRFVIFISRGGNWCLNRDAKSRFLEYAKYTQYSEDTSILRIARDGRRD
jgi:hypothetical protein